MPKVNEKVKTYMDELRKKLASTPSHKNSFVPGDEAWILFQGKIKKGTIIAAEYSLDKQTMYKIQILHHAYFFPTLWESEVFATQEELVKHISQ